MCIRDRFGDVEETGILIAVNEILEDKRVRHIESFVKQHPEALKITSGAHPIPVSYTHLLIVPKLRMNLHLSGSVHNAPHLYPRFSHPE